ncbi:MAG: thermonuclease family protein [Desulfopila sp.]|jgi:endonuclease YncB( thermonuclease family)|nr:thermonuclease family protein [Desulfopila sp.]
MRQITFICVFLFITSVLPISSEAGQNSGSRYPAFVIKILDGDTFEVVEGRARQRIRLWGIDTPEWDQPFSLEAKKYLKSLLYHRQIEVEPLYRDTYGRLVARIFLHGKCVNRELVKDGYAWVHVYFCKEKICSSWKKLEQNAKLAKTGLWGRGDAIAPWQWKRLKSK